MLQATMLIYAYVEEADNDSNKNSALISEWKRKYVSENIQYSDKKKGSL